MVTQTAKKLVRRLGPGLITSAADDDPSGIVGGASRDPFRDCACLGAADHYAADDRHPDALSARIGWVTGEGLVANIKKTLPRWLTTLLVGLLVAANTINIAADIGAMGEALRLFIGGPRQRKRSGRLRGSLRLPFLPWASLAPVCSPSRCWLDRRHWHAHGLSRSRPHQGTGVKRHCQRRDFRAHHGRPDMDRAVRKVDGQIHYHQPPSVLWLGRDLGHGRRGAGDVRYEFLRGQRSIATAFIP